MMYQPVASHPIAIGMQQPSQHSFPVNRMQYYTTPLSGFSLQSGKAVDYYFGDAAADAMESSNIDFNGALPLQELTQDTEFRARGVVKINNIPFTVTIQEVVHFIQRYSSVPMIQKHIDGFPVHVIMEKPTGKTMDCFVEFPSVRAAMDCARRFDQTFNPAQRRLGTRYVTIDLSSQAELMSAIFPRARLVEFDERTGQPSIRQRSFDPDWTEGFRGYFTLEEIFGIVRFAEAPSRSPFVLKCNQRVYESMISTLYKFPWAATNTYTVRARNTLFNAIIEQLSTLSQKVTPPQHLYGWHDRHLGLSQNLLLDLMWAGINAAGFSLLQKQMVARAAGEIGAAVVFHDCAGCWPFQTLAPDAELTEQATKFWLEIFDTGFDYLQQIQAPTSFEEYCIIDRNKVGFPIVEWTEEGLGLTFAEAIQIETALATMYFEHGRMVWAQERGVHYIPRQVRELNDVLRGMDDDYSTDSGITAQLSPLELPITAPRPPTGPHEPMASALTLAKSATLDATSLTSAERVQAYLNHSTKPPKAPTGPRRQSLQIETIKEVPEPEGSEASPSYARRRLGSLPAINTSAHLQSQAIPFSNPDPFSNATKDKPCPSTRKHSPPSPKTEPSYKRSASVRPIEPKTISPTKLLEGSVPTNSGSPSRRSLTSNGSLDQSRRSSLPDFGPVGSKTAKQAVHTNAQPTTPPAREIETTTPTAPRTRSRTAGKVSKAIQIINPNDNNNRQNSLSSASTGTSGSITENATAHCGDATSERAGRRLTATELWTEVEGNLAGEGAAARKTW